MTTIVGVHSLTSFGLCVPDIDTAAVFFDSFGLRVEPAPYGLTVSCYGQEQASARVYRASKKRLDHLSFACYADDFGSIGDNVARVATSVSAPQGLNSEHLWFRDPDGLTIGVGPGPKTSPDVKSGGIYYSSPALVRGAPMHRNAPIVRPRRFAHILVFSGDVQRSVDFYGKILGLRLSDRVGDEIAFMHGAYGSDHHLIAFARSSGPGLHHSSWEVAGVEEVGLGGAQMVSKGFRQGWGVGRHVLGSNLFQYIRDPWGSHIEYSADMDFVPAGAIWPAQDHDPEDAFFIWGPDPPSEWTRNLEAE